MSHSNVGLLDLPTEILLIILKNLTNIDVLYSLLNVDNQRLDIIVQGNTFTNTLDFLIDFANILPRIHQNVQCLTLDSLSMERILLAADYPNLTQLKLFNFNDRILSDYFTVETSFRHIFQQQITDLILVFENDFNEISTKNYTTDVYEYILKFFKNLKHLSVIGSFPRFFPPLVLHNLPSTSFFSSILNKLSIHVKTFDDCLALFDGRLKQLTTLILVIDNMKYQSSNVYHNDNLPNLKCFSLTTYDCLTDLYDTEILPLFRRLVNLEELTLYITIQDRTTLIDGNHISNEILIHIPQLYSFNFYFSINIHMNHLIHCLSKDDIQQSFSNIKRQQVDCIVLGCQQSSVVFF